MNDQANGDDSPILRRYYELGAFVGIDLADLEEGFSRTPKILQDAGELAARAADIENHAKHRLDIVKAEAAKAMRDDRPAISETRISSELSLSPEVQQAREALDKARLEAQVCAALYKALGDQARLLGKAADMVISGYVRPHELLRADIRAARVAAESAERTGSTTRGKPIARPS